MVERLTSVQISSDQIGWQIRHLSPEHSEVLIQRHTVASDIRCCSTSARAVIEMCLTMKQLFWNIVLKFASLLLPPELTC